MGNDRDVYQATIGEDHERKGWVELLIDADILESDSTSLQIANDAKVLKFYWVVPSWRKSKWSHAAKRVRKSDCTTLSTPDRETVNKALEDYVEQYVILIPTSKGVELPKLDVTANR